MRLLRLILSITLLTSVIPTLCKQPRLRKEIRDLSEEEYTRYIKAALHLTRPDPTTNITIIEKFTKIHNEGGSVEGNIHGTPAFLPWHRKFIRDYEIELQKVDPTVSLPYWDWSSDADFPHRSPILTDSYMGSNGNFNNSYNLEDGPFKLLKLNYPTSHRLQRNYYNSDGTIPPFADFMDIRFITNNKIFSRFTKQLEAIHGYPHVFIGCDMDFGTNTSPNDPLFFLHHAFIDLVWDRWQRRNKDVNQFDGKYYFQKVSVHDKLYGYNDTVESSLNTDDQFYCYRYPQYPRKLIPRRNISTIAFNNKNGIDDYDKFDKTSELKDQVFDSLIEDLTIDEAVIKLDRLLTKFSAVATVPNTDRTVEPPRIQLPTKFIARTNQNLTDIRELEKLQLEIRRMKTRFNFMINELVPNFVKLTDKGSWNGDSKSNTKSNNDGNRAEMHTLIKFKIKTILGS